MTELVSSVDPLSTMTSSQGPGHDMGMILFRVLFNREDLFRVQMMRDIFSINSSNALVRNHETSIVRSTTF